MNGIEDLPPELTDEREFNKMMAREQCEDEFELNRCYYCKERDSCSFRKELEALRKGGE
jgi:hypothetical protein